MTDAGVFVKASFYSRCSLRSLYQMDVWNKSHGFWKHSPWCARLALMIRVKTKWILEFSIQQFVFNPSGCILMCHTVCRKQNELLFSVASLKIRNLKEVWLTVLKRTLSTLTLYFEPRSPELHYHLDFNKKTLEGDVLNDQRLSHQNCRIVEKWPIYFLPPFGCLNGFLFLVCNQRTAAKRTLEGRVSAENRGGSRSREQSCWECDKEAFHTTRPAVNAIFLWGASGASRENMSRSEGGQSGSRYRFISGYDGARGRIGPNRRSL